MVKPPQKPKCLKVDYSVKYTLSDSVDEDQTAHFVQSDLDIHCPQTVSVSQGLKQKNIKFW